MVDELLDTCEYLVKLGSRLGADEIEVFAAQQESIEIGLENNEMKMAKRGASSAVGIRVFRNRSLGFASVNSLTKDRLDRALRDAISLAKNAPTDINNGLPHSKDFGFIPGLFDDDIADATEEDVIERAVRMLASAKGVDERISVDGGRFETAVGKKAIANSYGIESAEGFTAAYYDIGAHAVEGSNVSSVDYRFDGTRTMREDSSEEVAAELAETVIESLATEKMESCTGSVIFSPLSAIEILISPILFATDSDNIQKGISRFGGKIGRKVASPLLNLVDDATIPAGLSSSTFDREGVPHAPLNVIEGGVLKAFFYDSYTARKEGVESTGHASGTPRSVPSIDATNIRVKHGSKSLEGIIEGVSKGILVQRFSGRVDPVSGDFSGVAKGSKRIEKGALQGVVRETMITGNVYEILTKLTDLSKETKKLLDYQLPYFAVDDVSITGG
jgi:PmbA protein